MVGNILAVGLMSLGMGMSGIKDEPQMYAQDQTTYTITYDTPEDWNSRASTIYEKLLTEGYTIGNALTITGSFKFTKNSEEQTITLTDIKGYNNNISLNNGAYPFYLSTNKWDYQGNELTLIELEITSQTYYETMYEEPPNMGNDIIGSIASGLGLIGALATEFLAGFGALFYVQGALTPFAIFSLVMLGVAVSFAVVKLVLNLIRSNTGA